MKKQIIVMGLGRFGASVASTLQSLGHDVLALDNDEKNVTAAASLITRAVQADATSESVLKELGVQNYDVAIVSMGVSIEASVLSTILVKKLGVRYIIARANNELHGSILEKIGADVVVYPERETGIRTAHGMAIRSASDYMPMGARYGIAKVPALPYLVGRKLSDLGFGPGGRWETGVLLLQRKNEVMISPALDENVREGDILVMAGEDDKLERLLQEASSKNSGNH
jgi:trk system potassium uptake protein TrkA